MINAINPDPTTAIMTPREESSPADSARSQSTKTPSPAGAASAGTGDGCAEGAQTVGAEGTGESTRDAGGRGLEEEEWSKLRCGSLTTEELAKREKQKQERAKNRQNRCKDYPGFAFGSAMFGSDTTMKFNIIKNELHNIMRSQLKRVDGEVNALSSRIKEFDKKLEESEKYIREGTKALSEAVALQIEESKNRSEDDENESNLSAFDQHVLFLEAQLKEARIKASQSFQILEDCNEEQKNILGTQLPPISSAVVQEKLDNNPVRTEHRGSGNLVTDSQMNLINPESTNSVSDTAVAAPTNVTDKSVEANNNNINNNVFCVSNNPTLEDQINANVAEAI